METASLKNILLIGAGQLGSRHLQGLAKISVRANLYIVDPNENSLTLARDRYSEIPQNPLINNVIYLPSLSGVPDSIDLAIIATNADIRSNVAIEVINSRTVKAIIFEKVLFQKLDDYRTISRMLSDNHIQAWVNCPRRLFEGYRSLKKYFKSNDKLFFTVTGGDWGIGSNSIHYLDFASFFSENFDYEINAQYLLPQLCESKRKGFKEYSGTLIGRQKNGSIIVLNADPAYLGHSIVTVRSADCLAIIDETADKFDVASKQTGWQWESNAVCMEYQSQLTGRVAANIFSEGTCGLTNFEDSVKIHLPLISAVINFSNHVSGGYSDICPIT